MNKQVTQQVQLRQAIKTCLIPVLLLGLGLIFTLYAETLINVSIDEINTLFKLKAENLNLVLALTYINIFALGAVLCVCFKYQEANNINKWGEAAACLTLLYCFMLYLFTNSYSSMEGMTEFQSNLATFIWFPVWCVVTLIVAVSAFILYLQNK